MSCSPKLQKARATIGPLNDVLVNLDFKFDKKKDSDKACEKFKNTDFVDGVIVSHNENECVDSISFTEDGTVLGSKIENRTVLFSPKYEGKRYSSIVTFSSSLVDNFLSKTFFLIIGIDQNTDGAFPAQINILMPGNISDVSESYLPVGSGVSLCHSKLVRTRNSVSISYVCDGFAGLDPKKWTGDQNNKFYDKCGLNEDTKKKEIENKCFLEFWKDEFGFDISQPSVHYVALQSKACRFSFLPCN